jgi:hypothetical protein
MQTFTGNGNFAIFTALPVLWIAGWIIASIFFQKSRGRAIIPKPQANARFVGKGISGKSHRDLLTLIGGASNCLMVVVTDQGVAVTPTFPFNLMFLPQVYDLQHEIAFSDIVSVEGRHGLLGQIVDITFKTKAGGQNRIELRLRNGDALIAVIRSGQEG